jgi:hypothetical protein
MADSGYELFQAGKYAEAVAKFEAAETAYHAPTNLLFLARSRARMGKLVAAVALYERLTGEPLAGDAPPAFRKAQEDAVAEVRMLAPRVPHVRVVLRGVPPGRVVRVDVDGVAIPAVDLAQPIGVDPGDHTIAASLDGASGQSQRVQIAESELREVDLDFGAPGVTPPPPMGPVDAPPTPTSGRKGSIVPGVVALSVGAAGLGVGIATGVLALGKMSDLRAACPSNPCSPTHQGLADTTRTFGNVSTAGFVVGGVAAAAGIVLVIVRPRFGAADTPPPAGAPASATLRVGPGSAALNASF